MEDDAEASNDHLWDGQAQYILMHVVRLWLHPLIACCGNCHCGTFTQSTEIQRKEGIVIVVLFPNQLKLKEKKGLSL